MNDGPDYYDYDHCAVDDMVLEAAGASTALATPAAAAAADGQINRIGPPHTTRLETTPRAHILLKTKIQNAPLDRVREGGRGETK